MTFFEQELRKLFGHDTVFADARFAGNVCYGRLNEDVRIKARFVTCGYADHYEALKVTLINRREGEIDSSLLRFRDLWGMKQTCNSNFGEGVSPHIWSDHGKVGWYAYSRARQITSGSRMLCRLILRYFRSQCRASG